MLNHESLETASFSCSTPVLGFVASTLMSYSCFSVAVQLFYWYCFTAVAATVLQVFHCFTSCFYCCSPAIPDEVDHGDSWSGRIDHQYYLMISQQYTAWSSNSNHPTIHQASLTISNHIKHHHYASSTLIDHYEPLAIIFPSLIVNEQPYSTGNHDWLIFNGWFIDVQVIVF